MNNEKQSAFPVGEQTSDSGSGLTKREYFAAIALNGILSHSTNYMDPVNSAKEALQCADELLKQLES